MKLSLLFAAFLMFLSGAHAETVWWEAESSTDNSMPVVSGDPQVLSEGQWLYGKVSDGLYAVYEVTVVDGGRYNFYARRFWLHGSFRWRFDEEPWVTVEGLKQTVVDNTVSKPGPLSWIDLGYVTLKPGKHAFRVEIVGDSTYQFNKVYGFDCFALSNDGFTPLGSNKEGGPRKTMKKEDDSTLGLHLPRTLSLLSSSTPEHRNTVTILFYGQSIVANSHVDLALTKYLREQYPNAIIQFKNLAIGGYQAPILRKTAWQDMYTQNPDLIVFHVYGGETGELEEIFKAIRANMTAEVLVWTHHVDNYGTGIDQQRDASAEIWKTLAAKYGFEIADARTLWKERLKETHLNAQEFLVDQIHLNAKGTALLMESLVPHFRVNPAAAPEMRIRTIPLSKPAPEVTFDPAAWSVAGDALTTTDSKPLRIEFTGNRLDLTGLAGGTGSVKVLLDGKTPSTLRDTLAASRSTIAPGVWWPVITRVELGDSAVVEKYTMTFHDVAPDGSSYAFDVKGSVSGDEGAGKSGQDYKARSGHFTIKAGDIALDTVKKTVQKDLPPQFTVEWEVYSMSRDTWSPPKENRPGIVHQDTLVRCWSNGKHVVELVPNGDGQVGLKEIMVFSPNPL